LATGAKHKKAEVSGEEKFIGKGVSYCASCDGPLFKGKKVLVIGGGDTALSSALLLHQMGVDVTIVHRRDQFRAAESLQEKVKRANIKIIWNSVLAEIKGNKMVSSAVLQNVKTGKKEEIAIDGIFVAIGATPISELAKDIGIALDERDFIKVDKYQATNIPGIFAAGDCCDRPSKKIIVAAGDGAVAAESAYQWIKNL
jgi:thioredoxin reductase (NADPH)